MNLPKPKFNISQIVYHKLDPERAGIITAITFRPNTLVYSVVWNSEHLDESFHYDFEITPDRSFVVNQE